MVVLPKYKASRLSFRELCLKAHKDPEVKRYLRFITAKYETPENTEVIQVSGKRQMKKPITCQAVDLALFLCASRFHEELEAYQASLEHAQ